MDDAVYISGWEVPFIDPGRISECLKASVMDQLTLDVKHLAR